jgi:hypothetical protein
METSKMIEQEELTDEEILAISMDNTYKLILNEYDDNTMDEMGGYWLLKNAKSISALKNVISYYEEVENFERCAELFEVLNKRQKQEDYG